MNRNCARSIRRCCALSGTARGTSRRPITCAAGGRGQVDQRHAGRASQSRGECLPVSRQPRRYRVQRGDTVVSVAQEYGVCRETSCASESYEDQWQAACGPLISLPEQPARTACGPYPGSTRSTAGAGQVTAAAHSSVAGAMRRRHRLRYRGCDPRLRQAPRLRPPPLTRGSRASISCKRGESLADIAAKVRLDRRAAAGAQQHPQSRLHL